MRRPKTKPCAPSSPIYVRDRRARRQFYFVFDLEAKLDGSLGGRVAPLHEKARGLPPRALEIVPEGLGNGQKDPELNRRAVTNLAGARQADANGDLFADDVVKGKAVQEPVGAKRVFARVVARAGHGERIQCVEELGQRSRRRRTGARERADDHGIGPQRGEEIGVGEEIAQGHCGKRRLLRTCQVDRAERSRAGAARTSAIAIVSLLEAQDRADGGEQSVRAIERRMAPGPALGTLPLVVRELTKREGRARGKERNAKIVPGVLDAHALARLRERRGTAVGARACRRPLRPGCPGVAERCRCRCAQSGRQARRFGGGVTGRMTRADRKREDQRPSGENPRFHRPSFSTMGSAFASAIGGPHIQKMSAQRAASSKLAVRGTRMRTFITGASSGIGRGLALHYASAGAVVGLAARRGELLAELAREVEARGARPLVYAVDVGDTAEMAKHAAEFVDSAGGVDLVIANAGIGIPSGVFAGKAEPIERLMRINVIGVTNTVVPFVPTMVRQRSGVLVAVASVAGHRAVPGRAAYGASKAAVISFMEALRIELHGTGVHAMALCPGFIHTPMTAKLKKMPFVMDLDDALPIMTGAIARREGTFTFPWQMRLLSPVLRNAPEWFMRRVAPPPRPQEG